MFCNFCGKNFEATEGFEELSRSGHHYIRCEKCVYEQREAEYDWTSEIISRSPAAGEARQGRPGGRRGE